MLDLLVSMQETFVEEVKKEEEHLKVKAPNFWLEAEVKGDHLLFSVHVYYSRYYYSKGFRYSREMETWNAYPNCYKMKEKLPQSLAHALVYTTYLKEKEGGVK